MVPLGAGGMGEVYRARDTRIGRDVALKIMSEMAGAQGPLLERFEREARLASSLNHPNVVALYDVGLEDGQFFFVTELLQGSSLRQRLAKGPVPLATALDWAAQMAQGLAAAHERGIIHRDVKPENAFLTQDGQIKLIDFGIAQGAEEKPEDAPRDLMETTLSSTGSRTRPSMLLGTPGYMSPEQVRGEAVDARTDLFSLGAVLYEMLSGRRVFPGGPAPESEYAILHAEPDPLPATVPRQVAQLVRRCLEKDPGRRFQTAQDLAFNLELLRTPSSSGQFALVGGSSPRGTGWMRGTWRAMAAVGIVVALAVAGAAYVVGRRAARVQMPSVEQLTFRLGRVSAARFTSDERVAFSAAWGGAPLELFSLAPASPEAQSFRVQNANLLAVSATGELAVLFNST
ncbi:MAG TPA: serine/threonine-protein kinase, partial [Myxococcaceae bacterium]|nr:serine/threonine-protein kinase [Myxococcaceae bacterium]